MSASLDVASNLEEEGYAFVKNENNSYVKPRLNWKIALLLKNAIFTGKHLCWSLFFVKSQALAPKEASTQVFSYKQCKKFKNAYFEEHLWIRFICMDAKLFICMDMFWQEIDRFNAVPIMAKVQKQLPRVFCEKRVLKKFAKFRGKHLC